MSKKRILIYGMTSVIGGLERYLINFLQNIDSTKYEIDLLLKKDIIGTNATEINGYYHKKYIFPHPNFFKHPIKTFMFCKKIAEEKNYDIVYFNIINAGFILCALPFKLFSKTKIYIHSHNDNDENKIFTHYIFRPLLNTITDKKFACSISAARWMYGKVQKNVILINNAIDLSIFKTDNKVRNKIRKKLKVEDKFVIGHVGRFCYQKNQEFLIDMYYELQKEVHNTKLLLIGTGDLESEIKKKVINLKLNDKVIFFGTTDKVNEYFNAMDLFVLPSRFEGLGIVAIEAQAIGLPCLLSNKVPNEAKITNITEFLPFDKDIWKKKIINIMNKDIKIKNRKAEIIKAGYDLETEIKRIEKYF